MKQIMCFLVLIFAATAVFGTGQPDAATGELVEVTHMAADRGNVPAEVGTVADNWYVDLVNGRLAPRGIKLRIVVFPRGEYDNKVATLMATGSAPDVMWTWNYDQVANWSEEGGLLDYAPYLDEYGPSIRKLYGAEGIRVGTYYGKFTALRRLQT